nr:LLM class flavin-dependent oxidoreductase [Segeticoccus rhizosphaerae]
MLGNAGVVTGATSSRDLIDLAKIADESNRWDYVWVGDSLLTVPRLESVVLTSALAVSTRRLRLGIGCMASLGLRPAFEVAIQLASLDLLSEGRLTLAACTGPSKGEAVERELGIFGLTHKEKVSRMEDRIRLLRAASDPRGEGPSYEGAGLVKPDFVQRPFPIWMVANPPSSARREVVERSLARVARLGDGWMTFGLPPNQLQERIDRLKELGEGRSTLADSFPICVYVDVNICANSAEAMDDAVVTCRSEGRRNASAEQLKVSAAVGSLQECLSFIAPLVKAGVTHLALRPVSQQPRVQVERMTEELLPALASL